MSIVLEGLTKRYDDQPVVNNLSLEIADGEFFVLLGSSGSGKTTVLNVIAGLTELDRGRVLLHGRDVTDLPTRNRRVGFVFQNYALFQYMTVSENVEFGLSIRKTPKAEMRRRSDEMLELVGLSGLGDRMPKQLSGGQQQRVALARALAHEPDVLLLDEPLGALDAKIRIGLRKSLHEIQRKLGVAAILVTHDQEEAFDLADRIGVMSYGRLVEVGRPADLYQRPETEFVATFLGAANLLVGQARGKEVRLGSVSLLHRNGSGRDETTGPDGEKRVQMLFRPEDVVLSADKAMLDCPVLGLAEVENTAFGGSIERLRLRLPPIESVRAISPAASYGARYILVDATRPPDLARKFPLQGGDQAWVGVRRFHTLDHPGLSFLIVTDGSKEAEAGLALADRMAKLAHARVTLLGVGEDTGKLRQHLEEAGKQLGGGPAPLQTRTIPGASAAAVARVVEQQPHDLVILGFRPDVDHLANLRKILRTGEHHVLLVPAQQPIPAQALICVTAGEPGKDDVLFAGRLARHLGTEATLLTVSNNEPADGWRFERTSRFLKSGVQSLENLGVPARSLIRKGNPAEAILTEFNSGDYDLLVLGAPLADRSGQIPSGGVIDHVLNAVTDRATLIVRSHYLAAKGFPAPGQWKPAPPAGPAPTRRAPGFRIDLQEVPR